MNPVTPKISVITVVRNGEQYIEDTIQSIVNQTYSNFEYIVIDGNSSDNTVSIIRKYANHITYWVSEDDKGIYDAMNKGIEVSTGDWLLFINADDFLFEADTLEKAAAYLKSSKSQVAYGDVIIIYSTGVEIPRGADWATLKSYFRNVRMNISHQGVFHARSLFEGRRYDTSLKIAADYDLLLSYLKNNDADYIPMNVAKMRAIGVSSTSGNAKILTEVRKAQIKNGMYSFFPSFSWIYYAIKISTISYIIKFFGINGKNSLKKFLGMKMTN